MGRDVDVPLDLVADCLTLRRDEAKTIAVHGELSGDKITAGGGRGQGVAVPIYLDEFAAANEVLEALVQIAAVIAAAESKLLYQLLIPCRSVRLSFDPVQDFFVAKAHNCRCFEASTPRSC